MSYEENTISFPSAPRSRPARVAVAILSACILHGVVGCAGTSHLASVSQPDDRTSGRDWVEVPVVSPLEHPKFQATGGYAFGSFEHETSGSTLDDRTDGQAFVVDIEAVGPAQIGGGVRAEFGGSDNDLFEDDFFFPAEASFYDIHVHATFRVDQRRFRMPIRVGPYFSANGLEDATGDITWHNVGLRVEIEPEFLLYRGPTHELGLFGALRGGVHWSEVHADDGVVDERFDTVGTSTGVNIGLRHRSQGITAGLSFIFRQSRHEESDPEGFGLVVRGSSATFRGAMVELGVSF